ncbi:Polycystic kidney disease 2 1 protein [Phytophthora cinnamomi]|uniref:Polycystic kidney disease 2 1 protein n=1 Tax=Phytophthora cinnamomi TaxID=4785 RepID=UPI0035598461|nr:Polycystic kidney disease 2 1 protein [Phytophthora cinnamomi]
MKKLTPGGMAPSGSLQAKLDASADASRPLEVPIRAAYDSLCHDRKIAAAVRRIPVPVLYFSAFVGMLFAHIPATVMYDQGYAVSSSLATTGSDTITDDSTMKFYNIGGISDVFTWLTDTFVPAVFITEDYNGNELSKDRWGRVAMFNKVLGAVNFQVTRKAAHPCVTQPFLANLYPVCYDTSNTSTVQRLISFDTNATEAADMITALKNEGSWLDFSTEELLITIVTYNGELQGYAVTEMQLSFSEGGSVETSSSTTPALSNPYSASISFAADIVVLVFFLLAVGMQLRKIYRNRRLGLRKVICGNVWVFIEHASTLVVIGFYFVWYSIVLLMFQKNFRNNLASLVVEGKDWDPDAEAPVRLYAVIDMLKSVTKLTVALRLIATLAVFLLSLRILKRFRFHPRLSILTRTVANALHQFGAFFVIFIVIFVTFAVSGTILFGDRVEDFSSLQTAMETCVNMLFGNFDYSTIQGLYPPVCMFYYWGYMIVVSLVLLNMMLAIVLDAYAEVSSESYKTSNNLSLFRIVDIMLWDLLRWLENVVKGRTHRNKKEISAKTAPRVDQTTGPLVILEIGELGRADVVFRGRIRPNLLERGLNAMLEQAIKPTAMLTPRMLMDMFPSARLQENEARATLQHILDGLVPPSSNEADTQDGEQPTVRENCATNANAFNHPIDDGENETVVHPASVDPTPQVVPSSDDAALYPTLNSASVNSTESAEIQRLSAQLAALERKLDLLLQRSS